MSGDRLPILVAAASDTVLARAVEALGRFPREQSWVLIGGVAVFIRLGSITRPTADADTIARSQAELIQQLVVDEVTTVISGGDIQVPVGDGVVEIDVMDLADDPLPTDVERRAFALARRAALSSAVTERIIVTDRDHTVVADATIPVATIAALIALKTVCMVRRPHGNGSTSHRIRARGARQRACRLGRCPDRARFRSRPPVHALASAQVRPITSRASPHRRRGRRDCDPGRFTSRVQHLRAACPVSDS